jgi:uncharacterized protein
MDTTKNTEIVKAAFAAFLRGDVQSLLAMMDESVEWKPITGAAPHVPHAGVRRGKSQVGEFFAILGRSLTFTQFEPTEYIAERDRVVALGRYAATTAGGNMASEFVMIFTVRSGKIVAFQEFSDSAQLNAAYSPATVA